MIVYFNARNRTLTLKFVYEIDKNNFVIIILCVFQYYKTIKYDIIIRV